MKIQIWSIAMILLLAACQPQAVPASPVPSNTASAPSTNAPGKSVPTPLPTIGLAASPTPTIHSSSADPNAPNLIVVRDQAITNFSVSIDLVRAAQPGWLVVYLSKNDKPGHRIGYVVIQAGETKQLVVPLDKNAGVSITDAVLAGRQIFVVLQAGSKAPGEPVDINGHTVLEPFTVLASNP